MSISLTPGFVSTDWHGLRWSGGFLAAAAVLGFGRLFWVYADFIGLATETLIIATLGAAVFLGIGVLGDPAIRRRRLPPIESKSMITLRVRALLPIDSRTVNTLQVLGLLAVTAVATAQSPWRGLVGGLGAVLLLLLVIAADGRLRSDRRPTPPRVRLAVAVLLAGLTVAVLIFDILHLMVWNPLARVPGLSLDQIYSGLAAANKAQVVPFFLVLWAAFWGFPALLLPVIGHVTRLSLRFIVLLGLLLPGGAIFTAWHAAFGMGLGIADALGTDGGDAAWASRAVLNVTCQLALAAAAIIILAPSRTAWRLSVAPARLQA
jgi:hypothetical protein